MMMIDVLSRDMCWRLLSFVPANEIVKNRQVCREWRRVVDDVSQQEWKMMFCMQVCDGLTVSDDFDWRRAAVRAAEEPSAVDALCIWNALRVRVVTPWTASSDAIINSPLRCGVVRLRPHTQNLYIEFVYDDMFRLRGLARSCIQRNDTSPCSHCRTRSKQRCLNPRYDYYIRSLSADEDTTELNETLSRRLSMQVHCGL